MSKPIYTLPESFSEHICKQYDSILCEELTNAILHSEAPVSIRFQKPISPEILQLFSIEEPVAWEKNAFYLKERPVFAHDPLWHSGVYYVQEASSMILAHVLRQIYKNENWLFLDLCAAPGGKSSHLLQIISEQSFLVSNEVVSKRAQILKENLSKSGASNYMVISAEASDIVQCGMQYDFVLIDAPCSGEGLFRKDKEAINEWSISNTTRCSERQKQIVDHAVKLVKPGAYLFYSTCTYNKEENNSIAEHICSAYGFSSIPISMPESFGFTQIKSDTVYGYQAFPHRTKGEGFFFTLLQKNEQITDMPSRIHLSKSRFDAQFTRIKLPEKAKRFLDPFQLASSYTFFMNKEFIYSWPSYFSTYIQQLVDHVKWIHIPFICGELKKDVFIPHQELTGCSTLLNNDLYDVIHIDKINAIRFLKKENVDNQYIPLLSSSRWAIVVYMGYALGWLKILPNQKQNNYYPLNYRLRNA